MASKGKRSKNQANSQLLGKGTDKSARFKEDDKETLAFKVINAEQTKLLSECSDVDVLQSKMGEVMKITDHSVDSKQGAILDFYVSGFWWAKENNFTQEQSSAFFTVLHNLLENVKGENRMTVTENLSKFKKMMAGIGQENCEISGGLECFDLKQASLIVDYMHVSLFQHYKMYEFLFGATPAEEIIGTDLVVEVPPPADMPWPPPLEEAVSEEVFNTYIATPPPTPAPKTAESGEGDAEGEVEKTEEELHAEGERVADLMSQLTTEQVTEVMNSVFEEMLGGLKTDVASKLRLKENDFINRINKVHRIPSEKK